MTLPNFLIIGAQKAGTTWLTQILRQHPEVFMPRSEVHFFNLKANFSKGIDWYEQQFDRAKPGQMVGEKTPNYLWIASEEENRQAGRRQHRANIQKSIYQHLPDAKLIVVVRDPVKRAISAVNHYYRQGQMSPLWSIDELLVGKRQDISERYGVFNMGRYAYQLEHYYQFFKPDRVLTVVFEEEIVRDPEACLSKVCRFLEIDDGFAFKHMRSKSNAFVNRRIGTAVLAHARPTRSFFTWAIHHRPGIVDRIDALPILGKRIEKQTPSDRVLTQLYDRYAQDNHQFFNLLGHQIAQWSPG